MIETYNGKFIVKKEDFNFISVSKSRKMRNGKNQIQNHYLELF
jgi:hypothetical protein